MNLTNQRWVALLGFFGILGLTTLPASAQRTATATATVVNGFVVAITVIDSGEGYLHPPIVTILSGGGSGATATASVISGTVSAIAVTDAGSGYTSEPAVVIGSPDVLVMSILDLQVVPQITIHGDVGATNEVQWVSAFGDTNAWAMLTNIVLPTSPFIFYDTISPKGSQRFYRAVVGGGAARPAAPAGFVWLAPVRFTMGSAITEPDRSPDEGPQTEVTLTQGLFMCSHEVTQGEFQSIMGGNPSLFSGDLNRPVEHVTWFEATNYCGRLSEQERAAGRVPSGWGYRLPTEAEWEYAARAGRNNRFSFGDDPGYSLLLEFAWDWRNSSDTTHPVAGKRPSRWGLYDMNGNVFEWCLDWYGSYQGGTATDPKGAASGSQRVARGGAWTGHTHFCRSAYRSFLEPSGRHYGIGFRVVLAPSR